MKHLLAGLVCSSVLFACAVRAQQAKTYAAVISPVHGTDSIGETVYDVKEENPSQPTIPGVLIAPVYLSGARTSIPISSRMHHRKLTIKLEGVISASGNVIDGVVRDADGDSALAANTLKAFQKWKFKPATLDGKPVAVYVQQTFPYNIF